MTPDSFYGMKNEFGELEPFLPGTRTPEPELAAVSGPVAPTTNSRAEGRARQRQDAEQEQEVVPAGVITTYKVMADGYRLPIDRPDLANIGDLWGRGWSIFPLHHGTKRPALPSWLAYQHRTPTFEELERWFGSADPFNVAVVTGKVSGIFVIDVDSAAALAWVEECFPPCDMRVRTGKGVHLYFPYSGDRPLRNKVRVKFLGENLDLDVRCEGGFVVGPGSVHPSGAIYVREGDGW